MEAELRRIQGANKKASGVSSAFSGSSEENLVKWQLELDSFLERMDHLLRCHILKFEDGHVVWKPADKPEDVVFNDSGANEILKNISMYINRNTILSNYDEDTINQKVFDFGIELADLIEGKYEEMGINTVDKAMLYPIIWREIVDAVHSTYLRALNGGERESLTKRTQINQSLDGYGGGMSQPMQYPRETRSPLNPARLFLGKYK